MWGKGGWSQQHVRDKVLNLLHTNFVPYDSGSCSEVLMCIKWGNKWLTEACDLQVGQWTGLLTPGVIAASWLQHPARTKGLALSFYIDACIHQCGRWSEIPQGTDCRGSATKPPAAATLFTVSLSHRTLTLLVLSPLPFWNISLLSRRVCASPSCLTVTLLPQRLKGWKMKGTLVPRVIF